MGEAPKAGAPAPGVRWRRRVSIGAWAAAGVLTLTLVARALSHAGWLLDMVATFAAQCGVAALVLGAGALAARARLPGAVLLAVGVVHVAWLTQGRATWAGDGGSPAREPVSVLTFNALALNPRPELVVRALEASGADVIVVIESTRDIVEAIEASPGLSARYPHRLIPKPGHWAVVVLSRWPQRELSFRDSHRPRYRQWRHIFSFVRSRVIERPEGPFLVGALWPDSPKSRARWLEGNAEIREFAEIHRACLAPLGYPEVFCTDLNATPTGHRTELVRRLTGLRRGKPAWIARGTWPSSLPPPARVAIDDVLVSEGIEVASWRTLEGETGSDHVPVLVELLIPDRPSGRVPP